MMIFNFTFQYNFTTNLDKNDENLEVLKHAKLQNVIISDALKWDKNTAYMGKKEYLRKVAEFTESMKIKGQYTY